MPVPFPPLSPLFSFLFLCFFRGGQKILSDVGHAAFARLTPGPNSWHDRAMKVGSISIFRTFHLNPPSESHTPDSPDSPDSLIFSHQEKEEKGGGHL
jgi:hypothetical protein